MPYSLCLHRYVHVNTFYVKVLLKYCTIFNSFINFVLEQIGVFMMLSSVITFLRTSLFPTKGVLRLRLAPLHAYMGATIVLTLLVTALDFFVIQPDFFIPMWLLLHGFAIFFFYLLLVAIVSLYVQLFTKLYTMKMWAYRQAWPYTVSMTFVPTLLSITIYHVNASLWIIGFMIGFVYVTYPLMLIPKKNQRRTSV